MLRNMAFQSPSVEIWSDASVERSGDPSGFKYSGVDGQASQVRQLQPRSYYQLS